MANIFFEAGCTAIELKKFDEAVTFFTKSLELEKTDAAYVNRAFAYIENNNPGLSH